MKCPICDSEFCDHNSGQKNEARRRINEGLPAIDKKKEDWLNDPNSNPYYGIRTELSEHLKRKKGELR